MLAGVGMGNMIMNMIGLSVAIGMNSGIETLCSRAYGAKDLKLCGVYLNRGRFALVVCFLPITLLLLNAQQILVAIK